MCVCVCTVADSLLGARYFACRDPYEWISAYYQYDGTGAARHSGGYIPDSMKKIVEVDIDQLSRDGSYGNYNRVDNSDTAFAQAWGVMLDCGQDNLLIPRYLSWSVLPRSREYLNAEKPFDELWRAYFAGVEWKDARWPGLSSSSSGGREPTQCPHRSEREMLIGRPELQQQGQGQGQEHGGLLKAAAHGMAFGRGSKVVIHGLTGATQHNGKAGTVLGLQMGTGRYAVSVQDRSKPLALKEINLSPATSDGGTIAEAAAPTTTTTTTTAPSLTEEAELARLRRLTTQLEADKAQLQLQLKVLDLDANGGLEACDSGL